MRAATRLLIVLGLVAAFPSSASAEPQVSGVPGLSSAGEAIIRGADDATWIAEPANPGAIARVTPAGAVTEYRGGATSNFTKDRAPSGLTLTSDSSHSMWFLMNGSSEELGRITMSGAVSHYQLADGAPTSLGGGSDGALWMTIEGDTSNPDAIARWNTVDNTVAYFRADMGNGSNPRSITAGPDGALYFVETGGQHRLGRITTSGQITWRGVVSSTNALATSPFGALWLAQGSSVLRLGDTSVIATSGSVNALAAGLDGAMWTAQNGGIARIDAQGAVTNVPLSGVRAVGIAAGADNHMWVTIDRSPFLVRVTVPPFVSAATAAASTISANVNPNGQSTDVTVEIQRADRTWRALGTVHAGAGTTLFPVTLALGTLAPGTSSTVRVTATNAAGSTSSAGVIVRTPAQDSPAGTPPTGTSPGVTPVPIQGRTVVLTPSAGTVRFKAPGQTPYTTLKSATSVPVGSLIDTASGTVALASQARTKIQTGTFHGGKFRVRQSRKGAGMTELALAGTLSCPKRGLAHAAAATRKKRSLWGQDKGGRFRTHGQSSVATVRGTRWLTQDTCAGTLVRVLEGAVSVKPTKGGRAKLVRAGHRLLTRR